MIIRHACDSLLLLYSQVLMVEAARHVLLGHPNVSMRPGSMNAVAIINTWYLKDRSDSGRLRETW